MTVFVTAIPEGFTQSKGWVMLSDAEKRQITQAMGGRFTFDARQNFGEVGKDRPSAWAPLSKRYAKRVGRDMATLDLRGKLFRSFRMSNDTNEARCSTVGVPYDDVHQYGGGKIPARPYWPVAKDGNVTPAEGLRLQESVDKELGKIFSSR